MPGKFQNRPSHVPVPVEPRPEVLLVCRSGPVAETLLTVLKNAEYSVTHAPTRNEAVSWLAFRSFQAAVLVVSVQNAEGLEEELRDSRIPVLAIVTQPDGGTNAHITAAGVRQLLTALFAVAPLDWMKSRKLAATG